MLQENTVLMVSTAGGIDIPLRKVLNDAGMHVRVVGSCSEALQILTSLSPPAIVFCDASLPDGTWADILAFASGESTHVPVIVVSRVVDINLYINALERGAADFIVPPFYPQDLSHVMSCAMGGNVAIQEPAVA
jgi:DNA-binding NtrC family response regulator